MGEVKLPSEEEAEKGLTWRTMLAFLFVVFIIQPAMIYNWLVSGLWGLPLTSWAVILLWVGMTRMLGKPLNSKEIFMIRITESLGLMYTGYYFAYLLRQQYYANSEIARMFHLQEKVPPFFSPIGESALRSMMNRTFFDPAWVLPILVGVILPVALTTFANFTLGLLAFRLYVEEEKLEFPFASWDAQTMNAFGQRDRSRIRIIVLAIIAGIVYSSATGGLTQIMGIPLVPRYPIDLTHIVETMAPGASFVFTTDMIPYIIGFILPVRFTAAQLIANLALYTFGSAYVTMNGMWPEESQWQPGQGYLWLYQRSRLYFWNSLIVGWAIAVAVIPLIVRYRMVLRAFTRVRTGLSSSGSNGGKFFTSKYLLLTYLGTAALAIVLSKMLVTGFPIWILLLFTLGISFVMTLLQTHSAGVTLGFDLNQTYLREAMIYFSGYRGLDIWFIPPGMVLFLGGSGIAQQLKMATILGVNLKEYTKTYFLLGGLGLLGSFMFVSIFWKLNPIPGYAYPYTISAWPVEAMNFWRWQEWLWKGFLFREEWMLTGFGISAVLYLFSDLVLHIPSIPVAMITGMLTVPPVTLAQFLGSLGALAVGKFVGEEFWNKNKGFFFIGLTLGTGMVDTILRIVALLGRSTWLMPY
jgi:hypothetical protein